MLLLLLLLLSASPGELLWVRDTPLSGWWWLVFVAAPLQAAARQGTCCQKPDPAAHQLAHMMSVLVHVQCPDTMASPTSSC